MTERIKAFWQGLRGFLEYPILKQVTVSDILLLILFLTGVLIAERMIRRHLLQRVLRRTRFDASLQFAIAKIFSYAFIALGFYIALTNVGINLTSLAFLAGAIGVGIGFGLQNIISNFVSGIIILAERPITIGDRIEVNGVAGQVTKIRMRSTEVLTNDNIAMIVPNSRFITETVTNWSHDDPKVRFRIPVGVAYNTDIEKLRTLLLAVAAAHPQVLREPAPHVFFIGFGESTCDFELAVWTIEMTYRPRRLKSDLNFAIEKALRENGIEIPYPQRDLHIRSGNLIVQNSPERPGDARRREEAEPARPRSTP